MLISVLCDRRMRVSFCQAEAVEVQLRTGLSGTAADPAAQVLASPSRDTSGESIMLCKAPWDTLACLLSHVTAPDAS